MRNLLAPEEPESLCRLQLNKGMYDPWFSLRARRTKVAPRLALLTLLYAPAFVLAGCTTNLKSQVVVDKTGVDEKVYARDLAACANERPKFGIIVEGDIGRCMTRKGYRVLAEY